jgi:hypothetical protein
LSDTEVRQSPQQAAVIAELKAKQTSPQGGAAKKGSPSAKDKNQRGWILDTLGVNMPPPVLPPPPRPPQLQQIIGERVMTFDQLADKIGHKPKHNRARGLYKMSERYKAMEDAFTEAESGIQTTQQTTLDTIDDNGWTTLEQDLDRRLDGLITAATGYRARKAQKKKQQATRGADDLITDATRYKQTFKDQIGAIRNDPAFNKVKGQLTVEQAIRCKRLGISFADTEFNSYNDNQRDKTKPPVILGSGKMNSVTKLVHADGKARAFKPQQPTDDGNSKAAKEIGIDPNAPHYGNRNIAASAIGDVLGGDVIPQARYALHKGSVGLLMDMAPGKSPIGKVNLGDIDLAKDSWLKNNLTQMANNTAAGRSNDLVSKSIADAGYVQKDGGGWERYKKDYVKPWTAPPSPKAQAKLHAQLNQLEWCDLLCGQMDRQPENYMVEVNGDDAKVTGIDNDLCFGKTEVPKDVAHGYSGPGLPKLINKATLEKIKGSPPKVPALDFDRDVLPRLKGLLTQDEIKNARTRLADVTKHALDLESQGMVVGDWGSWRAPGPDPRQTASEFLAAQKGGLFGRDLARFFKQDGLLQ